MMKRILLIFVFLFELTSKQSFCQNTCIEAGQNILNGYYGLDFFQTLYKNTFKGKSNLETSEIGPAGLVFEHVVTQKFGFGVEIGYGRLVASYTEKSNYNYLGSNTYAYQYSLSTFRAQIRMNFHFVHTEHYDVYSILNFGYRAVKYSFESNDPSAKNESEDSPIPFGIKSGIGIRYFSQNSGIFIEMAYGTPFMSLGICFKFSKR